MKKRLLMTAPLAALALSGCMQGEARDKPPVSPAAKIVGEAENCIPLTQIRSSRIRDDWTIDFEGPGSKVWRNTLPNRCPGLRSADKFTYETSLSQLCSTDIIYVLQDFGGRLERGAGCGLGQFVPVRYEAKD